jgi:putative SOS response-associated peptidase YedK
MYASAGPWDGWKHPDGSWLQSFSIITVEASPSMRSIHDRMSAILDPLPLPEN